MEDREKLIREKIAENEMIERIQHKGLKQFMCEF